MPIRTFLPFQRCLDQPLPIRADAALGERLALQVADQCLADVGFEFAGALTAT